jgi:Carboxypeptidase regulatory-like domain
VVDDLNAQSDPLQIEVDESAERTVELVAWRCAELSGRVVDAIGAPLENASLSAWPLRERTRISGGSSRYDGAFRILGIDVRDGGVRGFSVRVDAHHRDFFDAPTVEVTLVAGKNELPTPFVFSRPAARVSGRVVDALQQPMGNQDVLLVQDRDPRPAPRSTRTLPNGEFRFGGIEAGTYVVISQGNCHGETAPFVVAAGAAIDLGDLVAPPERFELSGIAVFADGQPAAGAWVSFGREEREIDDEGRFSFWHCDPVPRDLVFRWTEANDQVRWRQDEKSVAPGGAPLRVVLVPRGVVFHFVDRVSREILRDRRAEIDVFGTSSSSKTYSIPKSGGQHTLDLDDIAPPHTLRLRLEGFESVEFVHTPPPGGYTERTVLEIEFTPVK